MHDLPKGAIGPSRRSEIGGRRHRSSGMDVLEREGDDSGATRMPALRRNRIPDSACDLREPRRRVRPMRKGDLDRPAAIAGKQRGQVSPFPTGGGGREILTLHSLAAVVGTKGPSAD